HSGIPPDGFRDNRSCTFRRLLGGHLRSRLCFAGRFLRREFAALYFRNDWRCGRRGRVFSGKQRLERCSGIGIDRGAGLLEFFDVAADSDAPGRGVYTLVEQRNNAASQTLTRGLRGEISAVKRVGAGDTDWNREERTNHLDCCYEPSKF